ncbi:MAG: hypothetical protein ACYCZ6_11440 [Polaromonas sp.]
MLKQKRVLSRQVPKSLRPILRLGLIPVAEQSVEFWHPVFLVGEGDHRQGKVSLMPRCEDLGAAVIWRVVCFDGL